MTRTDGMCVWTMHTHSSLCRNKLKLIQYENTKTNIKKNLYAQKKNEKKIIQKHRNAINRIHISIFSMLWYIFSRCFFMCIFFAIKLKWRKRHKIALYLIICIFYLSSLECLNWFELVGVGDR